MGEEETMTKKITSTKLSIVFPGFTYKDLITGAVLTVTDVKDDLVVFDNGLEVASLDAFEPVNTTVNPALLSDKKVESKSGSLYIDGEKVETGTLYIEEVLLYSSPRAVLKVRSLNKGYSEIRIYNVIEDKFFDPAIQFEEMENVFSNDTVSIFKFSNVNETVIDIEEVNLKQLKKDYSSVSVETMDEEVVFYNTSETYVLFYNGYLETSIDFGKKTSIHSVEQIGNDIVVVYQFDTSETTVELPSTVVYADEKGRNQVGELMFNAMTSLGLDEEVLIDGYIADFEDVSLREGDVLVGASIVNDGRKSLLLTTENGFIYTNNGFYPRHAEGDVAKKAIKDYPHFVKLDAARSRNVFTLANDKREVVKLEVVKTSDRGYTTNII